MKETLFDGRYIHIDQTTVQVLKKRDCAATIKSYMWILKRGDPESPVFIYEYYLA